MKIPQDNSTLQTLLYFISQSAITYVAYFSDCLLRPLTAFLQKSLHPVLLSSLIRLSMILGAINNR